LLFGVYMIWSHWAGRDRGLPEFNADKIRLLDHPPAKARATATPTAPATPSVAAEQPAAKCFKVAGMTPGRYQDLREAVAKLADTSFSLVTDNPLPWWVYWPPEYEAAQRQAVLKKIALAGVKDALHIAKGAMAQSFALGLYPNEGEARGQRDALRQKGLDKAEYGIRPGLGTFQMRFAPLARERAATLRETLPTWVESIDCPS
jgi:hypothetical protein